MRNAFVTVVGVVVGLLFFGTAAGAGPVVIPVALSDGPEGSTRVVFDVRGLVICGDQSKPLAGLAAAEQFAARSTTRPAYLANGLCVQYRDHTLATPTGQQAEVLGKDGTYLVVKAIIGFDAIGYVVIPPSVD